MADQSWQYTRAIAVVWLLIGISMMAAAFVVKVPNRQYMKLLAEKVILEKQNKAHDHLNPDAIPQYRAAWKNPLFIFGVGAFVLAGVQLALASKEARPPSAAR
jgi:Na+/melibiose symporter-like transporter